MIKIGDREEILKLWIETESKAVGRPLVEGQDFEVERTQDAIYVTYYGHMVDGEPEVMEITDTSVTH